MFVTSYTTPSLRFRRWSRKSYAAFLSIGRHVTIGKVKGVVADIFLGKQKNAIPELNDNETPQNNAEEEIDEPPDKFQQKITGFISIQHNDIPYKRNLKTYYVWLMAIAVGHFYFKR